MASIILSAAGSAVGQNFGGPVGAYIGARIGQTIGSAIDRNVLGGRTQVRSRGPRLADLGVQSSTYGKMIPLVYGSCRVGGNIIWSRPIKETASTSTNSAGFGGKGGGGRVSQSTTTYSYSVSIAVSVCEGPVDAVLRIWADAKQIDLASTTLRIYLGGEDQLPDSLISAFEGTDRTPAYRGQCYVVFEDFPLAEFGNRIPNFTFEIKRTFLQPDYQKDTLESMIQGMVMIPGAGEFVYDTQVQQKIPGVSSGAGWVQQGSQQVINQHNPNGIANSLLSLDQLQQTCPNVEWVSLVVAWFGNSLQAADCVIRPGVEYQAGATTSPDSWQVAGYQRSTARLITQIDGAPQYGGTPDDDSLLRYAAELRARGYKILFYPLIFMDVEGKPWRGELTGSAADVSSFFTKSEGYQAFILHYANLMAAHVDAFSIGSEMKGLTKVSASAGVYPAVGQLATLAASVKSIVGSEVKVTYAADWSEYHSTTGGWYHMDPLWASPAIDVIGIDAYFPLTDSPSSVYDIDTLRSGWTSGEGYDWFYSDPARTTQSPLSPAYAWKNLSWFWNNTHTNPGGAATPWIPQSKKIWFTEYGFPSVDCASNQPNVFYDPTSVSSALPYFSRGRVDFRAQRAALTATELQWKNSPIVERMFVWTWDARPYPYWPDLRSIWSDGEAWKTGHWVQGKLGVSSLGAVVRDLCTRAGLDESDLMIEPLRDPVEGYVVSGQQSVRDCLETLAQAYLFDSVESDGLLKFITRAGAPVLSAGETILVETEDSLGDTRFVITRAQEVELPRRVNVVYLSRIANYQTQTQYSQREMTRSRDAVTLDLPLVLSDQIAKNIAEIRLYSGWVSRVGYEFSLSSRYSTLDPGDVVELTVSGVNHRMRIVYTRSQSNGSVLVRAVADDASAYDFYSAPGSSNDPQPATLEISPTSMALLDIPALPGDEADRSVLRIAGCGVAEPWSGAAVYQSDDGGANFTRAGDIVIASPMGRALNVLPDGGAQVFDVISSVNVSLLGQASLQSVTELALLNGANLALLGQELIQFRQAVLIEPGQYQLSGLLRGRLGTEWASASHVAGEPFVLLDGKPTRTAISNALIGLARDYKAVSFGTTLSAAASQNFTYRGVALKPYSPVHLSAERSIGGDITLRWIRRSRLGGTWQDAVDAPLNESAERYDVEVLSGASVVRSWLGLSAAEASYSASEQLADFGSVQSSLAVRVYQLSAQVGRGYAADATV